MKICKDCGAEKREDEFRKDRNQCLTCYSKYLKDYRAKNKKSLKDKRAIYIANNPEANKIACQKYYDSNPEKFEEYKKEYYLSHQDKLIAYQKDYRVDNKDAISEYKKGYYQDNKEAIVAQKIVYQRDRYRNDPAYRLRSLVGRVISRMLKSKGSSKNGGSITKHLPFTPTELKNHLEKQFEPWMNWNNQGKYNHETWNDIDQSTWTWQLDHIIPQSNLPYSSMADDNFQKCWALSNLRPLNAKQNLSEGNRR